MFYLLENGEIIDSEELSNSGIHINIKENVMYLDSWLGTRFYGTIKKQSENVYNLIDWEKDLVRITWSDGKNFIIDCNINKSEFFDGYYRFEWITAIYKPDEKGNYIKVWEETNEKED